MMEFRTDAQTVARPGPKGHAMYVYGSDLLRVYDVNLDFSRFGRISNLKHRFVPMLEIEF